MTYEVIPWILMGLCIITLVVRIDVQQRQIDVLRGMTVHGFDKHSGRMGNLSYRIENVEKVRAYDAETCRLN